ncbi:MAG: alkaline phosphatase family protein [Bacteroidetes bacterium]|nr:alkaline phosphatase family protein [Bacteroidota bacterium]
MKTTIRIFQTCIFILASFAAVAGNPNEPKPKLIVGIVIDQMRYDYITRYWNKFGENGFKKLVNQGYNCSNTHYNYVPTYTGPGHASIYTGTTPAAHGIISNDWFNRATGRNIYVTEDANANGVGTTSGAGKMSPSLLLTTTVTDELRTASNFRSKVIGIALKDRGAILPAGHSANAAYWYEGTSGNWISSSWYMNELPSWVSDFNNKKLPAKYLQKAWTTLQPIETYVESTADNVPYEESFPGEAAPVFPHDFPKSNPSNFDIIKRCPYGNEITKEFALAALKAENLGKDEFTDFLAISFSSPDYVGHQFGTHAIETQDTYLRLDLDLAELIAKTEEQIGKGNVLFFLTADHAAIPNPKFLSDHKIPAGLFNISAVSDSLNKFMLAVYGPGKWVLAVDNDQVYLDHTLIETQKLNYNEMCDRIARFLIRFKGVSGALTAKELATMEYTYGIRSFVQKGFYQKRSGDVAIILEPGLIEYKLTGTTHGSPYTYDTHVPLLFYGWNIQHKTDHTHINITDIAPTISVMLGIQPPNASTGNVIQGIFEK